MVTTPASTGASRPGIPGAWQTIPFLLGAEATLLLVWPLSEHQISYLNPGVDDKVSALLGIAPLLTILVALGLGWIDRRSTPTGLLLGLTLAGPVLLVIHLLVGHEFPLAFGGLLATPACTAAAAGLVSGVRRHPGRGYAILAGGGVAGFLVLALPMWVLGTGSVAECPVGCNSLEMRGIAPTAIFVGVIGLAAITPGFAIGSLVARWLRAPAGREHT